jgi:hypothetical protein
MVGSIRELSGLVSPERILDAGVHTIKAISGELVQEGLVLAEKLRPARRHGKAVLVVEKADTFWQPLKLD